MKTGAITKSCSAQATDEDMALINKYTRRTLTSDEVYIFSLVLCDNDIDRDNERFTVESLFALEGLFVGKTGILDHDPKANNQTARIFWCKVEAADGKKTATGDDYFRLVAKAYIPICDKNRDIITAIDSGIIKEVSVGCAVKRVMCSVCNNELNSAACNHIKGRTYGNDMCYGELCDPYDAYEFSFVAVPAQKNAGVIKAFSKHDTEDKNMNDIIKSIKENNELNLDCDSLTKLRAYISELEKSAENGRQYVAQLKKDVIRLSTLSGSEIPCDTMKSIVEKLDVCELRSLCDAYKKSYASGDMPTAQLHADSHNSEHTPIKNTQFTI